jgi:hypothetical protein
MKICLLFVGLIGMTFNSWSQTTLLFEDFNAGMPSGWGIFNEDGLTPNAAVSYINDAWVVGEDTDSTGMMDSCAISTSYYDPTGQSDDWMVLPAVTLGASSNYLFWDAKSEDPSFPDSYEIWINTTGGSVSDFTDSAFFKIDNENPIWQSHVIELDSFANETIYVAFRNVSDDKFILVLDNIHITEFDPLSVNSVANIDIQLYPNPVVNYLTVDGAKEGSSYVIMDMTGRSLETGVLNENIDLTNLKAGNYLLGLKSPNSNIRFKRFIKD